jgi:hypothetical protein
MCIGVALALSLQVEMIRSDLSRRMDPSTSGQDSEQDAMTRNSEEKQVNIAEYRDTLVVMFVTTLEDMEQLSQALVIARTYVKSVTSTGLDTAHTISGGGTPLMNDLMVPPCLKDVIRLLRPDGDLIRFNRAMKGMEHRALWEVARFVEMSRSTLAILVEQGSLILSDLRGCDIRDILHKISEFGASLDHKTQGNDKANGSREKGLQGEVESLMLWSGNAHQYRKYASVALCQIANVIRRTLDTTAAEWEILTAQINNHPSIERDEDVQKALNIAFDMENLSMLDATVFEDQMRKVFNYLLRESASSIIIQRLALVNLLEKLEQLSTIKQMASYSSRPRTNDDHPVHDQRR